MASSMRHVAECTRKTTLSDARTPETAAVLVAVVPTVTVWAAVTIVTQRVSKEHRSLCKGSCKTVVPVPTVETGAVTTLPELTTFVPVPRAVATRQARTSRAKIFFLWGQTRLTPQLGRDQRWLKVVKYIMMWLALANLRRGEKWRMNEVRDGVVDTHGMYL